MELAELIKKIRKECEDDTILFTAEDFSGEKTEGLSTGLIDVDIKSGIGGVPVGRVTEIYGPESSGKTVLCSSIVAQAQKNNLLCAYVDTEQALDYDFATKIGVDFNKLLMSQPSTLEDALKVAEKLVDNELVKVLIFDSLVGLGTEKENEDEFGKANYGGTKLYYQWFRRNIYTIRENKIAVVFTNQVRDKMNSMFQTYDTPGGHAIKHYSSMMIVTSKTGEIKSGTDVIGVDVKAHFKKNRVAPPFKTANFSIYFDRGIWTSYDLLTNSIERGILSMRGPYVVYQGETLAQGKQAAADAIESDEALQQKLRNELFNV